MRWAFWSVIFLAWFAAGTSQGADRSSSHDEDVSLYGPVFKVGSVKFTVPFKWVSVPPDNENRAAQWKVPPAKGQTGASGDVVVFFFGPNVGGNAKENIDGWVGSVTMPDGQPATPKTTNLSENGYKISQVAVYGTYSQGVPVPGLPPLLKTNYGLLGAIIETSHGTIYWRFTGPEPLVKANAALFNKILASIKPLEK